MKAYFALTLAILISSPSIAQEPDNCASVGELAANIMTGRQNGVVMSKAMSLFPADNPATPIAVELVKMAYAEPQWSTDGNKQQAVIDFQNAAEYACYTAD